MVRLKEVAKISQERSRFTPPEQFGDEDYFELHPMTRVPRFMPDRWPWQWSNDFHEVKEFDNWSLALIIAERLMSSYDNIRIFGVYDD